MENPLSHLGFRDWEITCNPPIIHTEFLKEWEIGEPLFEERISKNISKQLFWVKININHFHIDI